MPPKQPMQPRNILEVINQNIVTVSEDLHTLMNEVAALKAMFNAPEKPNALGEDGAMGVSREQ